VSDTKEQMGSIKAAKAAARGFRESGAKPREAAKAALTATGAAKHGKQKSKRKKPDTHTDADEGPGSKAPRSSRVYAGAVLILENACVCYFLPCSRAQETLDHDDSLTHAVPRATHRSESCKEFKSIL
jgi:hypothetical protein